MEFNSFGPAVGRLGSDSSRGGGKLRQSRSRGDWAPLAPLTLTTAAGGSGGSLSPPPTQKIKVWHGVDFSPSALVTQNGEINVAIAVSWLWLQLNIISEKNMEKLLKKFVYCCSLGYNSKACSPPGY